MSRFTKKLPPPFVLPLAVLAGFLFISILVMVLVPVNMDESIHYHPLSCDFYDNAKYHIFREPCDGSYDLNFLGFKLKRAFHYSGSLSSYIYSIFFRIYPSIITQRLVGILFLLLLVGTVVLLEKENKVSVLVLFGLSYPIIYQVVNDTGPVRYGLWVCFLTPLLARYIVQSQHIYRKVLLNIVLGVTLFLAVEDKTFFLYLPV